MTKLDTHLAAQTQRFASPTNTDSNFMASNKNLKVSPAQKTREQVLTIVVKALWYY